MPEEELIGTAWYLVGQRLVHYSCFYPNGKGVRMTCEQRLELLFVGTAILLDYELPGNTSEQLHLHLWGNAYSFAYHTPGLSERQKSSLVLEIFFALVRCLHM